MNILFVLYGDLTSNSATPLALYAREFAAHGHRCAVAIPSSLESVREHANPAFRTVLYADALAHPDSIFADGRAADVVHAWTPRENVRRFVTRYLAQRPAPLVIYLEDHESWISCWALGLEQEALLWQTEQGVSDRSPDALSHPFRYRSFIGLADAAVVIQGKLSAEVPAWVSCDAVMSGVDLDFFSPRAADRALRKRHGIADKERVIVYPGGVNGFTRPGIETVCRAVGLMNRQGYPCRLLRTGPFALDFLDKLPQEAAQAVVDLGVVPRADLPDLLALADVLVQPGKIDAFEDLRLPGKLPEFFAMGRPVVTPDVNIGHLLRDGVDAVLTHSGTAEEIAEKCMALFADPQQAEKIGRAGRKFAEKHFDVKLQSLRLEAAYATACARFNASIAAQVWQLPVDIDSVDLLLAHKLNLMAASHGAESGLEIPGLLRELAQLIQSKRARINGLEAASVARDRQVASLIQAVAERDAQIASLNQALAERVEQLNSLNQTLALRDEQAMGLHTELNTLRQEASNLRQAIHHLRQSASWRITSPLRWLGRQLKLGSDSN